MLTHTRNIQHTARVTKRLERLLDIIRRYPGLSTMEYSEAAYGAAGWRGFRLRQLTRTDLDRLWALGLVAREKNKPLAQEDGVRPQTWYWFALPIDGQACGYTVTVRERIASC